MVDHDVEFKEEVAPGQKMPLNAVAAARMVVGGGAVAVAVANKVPAASMPYCPQSLVAAQAPTAAAAAAGAPEKLAQLLLSPSMYCPQSPSALRVVASTIPDVAPAEHEVYEISGDSDDDDPMEEQKGDAPGNLNPE